MEHKTHCGVPPVVDNNWRTLVVNYDSVACRKAELGNLVSYTDPDVLILTETHMDAAVNPSEFLPPNYQGSIRKDKNRKGGGVMIAFKTCYNVESIELNTDAETVWASVSTVNNKKLIICACYRQPDNHTHQGSTIFFGENYVCICTDVYISLKSQNHTESFILKKKKKKKKFTHCIAKNVYVCFLL